MGEGWLSFPLKPNWASTSPLLRRLDGVKSDEVGLRNLSKIAMTKNMEMRMAVATKPNDTALTELLKAGGLPGCSSLCMFSGAPIGGHSRLCSFTTTIFTPLALSLYLGPIHSYHVNFYVTFLQVCKCGCKKQKEKQREVFVAAVKAFSFTPSSKLVGVLKLVREREAGRACGLSLQRGEKNRKL